MGLDHNFTGSKFASLAYGKCKDLLQVLNVLFMWKVNFEKIKSGSSHWEISVSCTIQEIDNVLLMYNTLLSSFCSIMIFFCQVVAHGRLKTIIENCKRLALKVVVVAYKRWLLIRGSKHYWCDLETFGILENWSLRRGGRNWRFHCTCINFWFWLWKRDLFPRNSWLFSVKLHSPCGKITEQQMYLTPGTLSQLAFLSWRAVFVVYI